MNVCVPYTELQPATQIAVRDYDPKFHGIAGEDGYVNYWRAQWAARVEFINVEHDVVPWPGALEALASCTSLWCVYGYSPHDDFADEARSLFPYLGCVKFTQAFIDTTAGMWTVVTEPWDQLDRHVGTVARSCGLKPHQHFPPVLNANPVLL